MLKLKFRFPLSFAFALAFSAPGFTAGPSALNPKISVAADFVAQAGPGPDNDLSMREVEVAVQSEVDPNTRADVFFALHDGESFELEEGYITLLALPFGLQARGGKFLANFGRLNIVHNHELPQVDRPLVLVDFLGEHGVNSTGAELSRVFTPMGVYAELSYAFLEALGEEGHGHDDAPATTVITDDNGNPVTVEIAGPDEPADPNGKLRDFAQVARLRLFRELSSATNVELGLSGAHYEPEGAEHTTLGGVDLTVRWKPLREGLYRSLVWRTEAIRSRRRHPAEFDPAGTLLNGREEFTRSGAYSYVEWQPARTWRIGVRGDYVESPEGLSSDITRAVAPYVTIHTSEFNRYRLQYRYRDLPAGGHDHAGFLQWTVVLGPHGAHPY